MKFKHKLGYMFIGCLFTIAGYIIASLGGVTNQQVLDKMTFTGNTQQEKSEMFDVTLIVECENLNMNKAIRKITKQELGKLLDVSLDKIDIIPDIYSGQNPGQFIIVIIALDDNCQTCDKIAITSIFLSRDDSIPDYMINPKDIKAYNSWKKLNPCYSTQKGPIGYCSKIWLRRIYQKYYKLF